MRSFEAKPHRESVQRAKLLKRTLAAMSSNSCERDPAAIGRSDKRTHTGPGNDADRNTFLFQDLQNPNVRDTAGETSAQSEANGGSTRRQNRNGLAGEFPPEGLY